MKKWLIGSFVGAILVFAWQFLSWTILPVHSGEAKYTPAQNEIMNSLSASLRDDGVYMLPTVPPGGKPWATVIYRSVYKPDMAMQLIRGFLVDWFLVFTLIYILTRAGTPTTVRILAGSVAVGLFTFLA